MLALILGALAMGANRPPSEFQVEAACLLKFIHFVDWPDDAFPTPDSPMIIGVLGADPFGHDLDEISDGEICRNHRVVIRRFQNWKEVTAVHVLYICASERGRLQSMLPSLSHRSILTVSDLDDFSKDGGIIRFVLNRQRMHFQINVNAARQARLKISSKLLQLADIEGEAPAK